MTSPITYSEALEAAEARYKKLQDLSEESYQEMKEIEKQIRKLRLGALLETDLLNKVEWKVSIFGIAIYGREVPGFAELLKPWGYHDRFESTNWTLSFDDGDLVIAFDDPKKLTEFIETHKLKVDFTNLHKELENQKEKYLKIKNLVNQLTGKSCSTTLIETIAQESSP